MLRQGDQRADADARKTGGLLRAEQSVAARSVEAIRIERFRPSGNSTTTISGATSRTLVNYRKPLAKQAVLRVRDRDLRH